MAGVQYGQIVSEAQVRSIIRALGLVKRQETVHDFLLLCPFHRNNYTPSLSLSKDSGTYICFNPACGARGDLVSLVKYVNRCNDFEAMRFMLKNAPASKSKVDLEQVAKKPKDFVKFDEDIVRNLHENLYVDTDGLEYMHGRNFTDETLDYFNIGYSSKQSMVTVPVYTHSGLLVGMVGRSVKEKRFKNTTGLPGTRIFFNVNNAKRYESCIVVESAFDAMTVHQAGFPNVVATLGGYLSKEKHELLSRYFNTLIIATDKDEAGISLGKTIDETFDGVCYWATPLFTAKDATDMSDEDIANAINNSITSIECRIRGII